MCKVDFWEYTKTFSGCNELIQYKAHMRRYRLYIDESGDHTYSNLNNPNNRYLCLLGIFIRDEVYRTNFHPTLESLKQKHFPHNPDDPIVLHRKDIINKRGIFGRLKDSGNREAFDKDLLSFFSTQDYKIVGVAIDKERHIQKHGFAAFHPYHYCIR